MTIFDLKVRCYRLAVYVYWRYAQVGCRLHSVTKPVRPKLMIIPCEPWTVVGSRGDEAMIMAILQNFRSRYPEAEVVIVTGVPDFGSTADGIRLGGRYVFAWRGRIQLRNIFKAILDEAPTECYVLGADCMDGKYSVLTSLLLLASADLAARLGIKSRLTGFSFNDHPATALRSCFRSVSTRLPLRLRDPLSLMRFKAYTARPATLVADVAFLLQPQATERVQASLDWAKEQKGQGRTVLGFNLHAMLITTVTLKKGHALNTGEGIKAFQAEVREQLKAFLSGNPSVAMLFIPHDFRCGGDNALLTPLLEDLQRDFPDRATGIKEDLTAAELKALCGGLDGLFTSRMHLGIAALGMGVPVACFAYQGKFSGLFDHFAYPKVYLLDPSDVSSLAGRLNAFSTDGADLREKVLKVLPRVKELAAEGIN